MSDNQWDQYAELYNQGIGVAGDTLHKDLIDPIIFEFLGDYKEKVIVDVGCGNGYLLRKLAPFARNVIGIDSSSDLLQFAKLQTKEFANVVLQQGDAMKTLPIDDSAVDVVIVNMVAQYLPNLENLVRQSHRILSKNGSLIIVVDHPGHALFLRAEELLGKRSEKFLTSGSYFLSEKRTKKSLWDKAILEYYHRPIQDYVNIFTPFFHLSMIKEMTDDGEMPRILGLHWKKI